MLSPSDGEGGERAGGVEVGQEDLGCGDSVVHSASHENSCSGEVFHSQTVNRFQSPFLSGAVLGDTDTAVIKEDVRLC